MGDGDGNDGYDDRDRTGSSSESDDYREPENNGDGTDESENGTDDLVNNGDESGVGDSESPRTSTGGFDESNGQADSRADASSRGRSDNARGASETSRAHSDGSRGQSDNARGQPNDSRSGSADQVTIEDDGLLRWFFKTEDGTVMMVRDVLTSVAIVAAIGLVLFAISGIWPPLVAVESGSMHPNMQEGDLIFVVGEDRFVGDDPVDGTGVVTLEDGQESGYDKFGKAGDVVVFQPGGSETATPVIHRAHFWVEKGDNWVEQADPAIIGEDTTCSDIESCPAEHDGFITKGDSNSGYDQEAGAGARSDAIVKPEWITGKASFRIPWLGNVRLLFDKYLFGAISGTLAPQAVAGVSVGASSVAGAVTVTGKHWSDRN